MGFEDEFAGFVEGEALFLGYAHSSEADGVDVVDGLFDAFDDHEGGDVADDSAHSADHGHFSDADELVDTGHASDGDVVFDGDVAGDADVVGDGDVVLDLDIVAKVDHGHEVVVVADFGEFALFGSAVDGDVFSEDVVVANLEVGGLAFVLSVLGVAANDGALGEDVVFADGGVGFDGHVGVEFAPVPDHGSGFDITERSDGDIVP